VAEGRATGRNLCYTRLVYTEHDFRILEIGCRADVQRRVLDPAGKLDGTVAQLCYEVAE
jgi:hypothetical protein